MTYEKVSGPASEEQSPAQIDYRKAYPRYKEDELVFWGDIKVFKDEVCDCIKKTVDWKKIRPKTATCDPSLYLLKGEDITLFASGEVARSGTGARTTASGTSCLNFVDKSPKIPSSKKASPTIDLINIEANDGPIVAILDTGIHNNIRYQPISGTCIAAGEKGWNFVNNNANVTDKHKSLHGTFVTKFILDSVDDNSINILPVKVLNDTGSGTLFNLLQGFAYACESGAKIINASLGFYHYGVGPPEILGNYIRKKLTERDILLITAAGNKEPKSRKLSKHSFYPAALSSEFPNIISVTTVNENIGKVSSDQNASPTSVNVGVVADNGDFFLDSSGKVKVWGSSFATPRFTGKLCSEFRSGLVADKDQIFTAMLSNMAISEEKLLAQQIEQGRCMKKNSKIMSA